MNSVGIDISKGRSSKNYMWIRVICKIEKEKSLTKRRITGRTKSLTFASLHVQ